jgi:ABC-type nitrate/sulfonate/bicarbonate transport system substrate-binding protein
MHPKVLIVAVVSWLVVLGVPKTDAQPKLPHVKIGVVTPWQVGVIYNARNRGWFRDAGVDVEILKFAGGPPAIEALAAKSIDLAYVGGAPAHIAAARGVDFKIIAGMYDATNLWGIEPIVRPAIRSVEDLRNKTILVPIGTLPHLHVMLLLDKFGLTPRDVKIQHMGFAESYAAFITGIGDAAVPLWPQCLDLVEKGHGKHLTGPEGWIRLDKAPGKIIKTKFADIIAARGGLLKSEPDTVMKFLTAYFRSIDWTRAHPDEALRAFLEIQKKDVGVEISTKVAQTLHSHTEWLPVDVQLATLFNKNYGEGSLYVDAPFILGFFANQGVDVKRIPMDGVIDTSFLVRVQAASKR